jgi:hypothetical protein
MTGKDMIERGDFYALMFFVVSIANLLIYAVIGWYTNIYGQVGLRVFVPSHSGAGLLIAPRCRGWMRNEDGMAISVS